MVKKLTRPIAKNVLGTTGILPQPKISCAIMPATSRPSINVKMSNAKAPHLANKSVLFFTGVASSIP